MGSLALAPRFSILTVAALWPCMALAQARAPLQATCSAAGARFAIGEVYTPAIAERARQAARALAVRKIEPGGAYTMELSPDRLNIEVDRSGVVRDLTCG